MHTPNPKKETGSISIDEIEINLDFADSSTTGITKDNSPRPNNVRLPLVDPEEEEAERPKRG